MTEYITGIDISILNGIADNLRCELLDALMPIVTAIGDHGIIPIMITLLLLALPKTRRIGISMAIAISLGFLVGNIALKNLTARIRPYEINGNIALLVPPLSDFSFPSGHTLVCFEVATVVSLTCKRWLGAISFAIAASVAFSRLYLYVHYPTDVLAGIMLGILFGILGVAITDKALKVKNHKRSSAQI